MFNNLSLFSGGIIISSTGSCFSILSSFDVVTASTILFPMNSPAFQKIVNLNDYSKFNKDFFNIVLEEIDWSLAIDNKNINLGPETFLQLFSKTLDRHAPYK